MKLKKQLCQEVALDFQGIDNNPKRQKERGGYGSVEGRGEQRKPW